MTRTLVKVSLHAGAQLVPVLVFGENDVWHARHVKEGKLHQLQEAVKRCVKAIL